MGLLLFVAFLDLAGPATQQEAVGGKVGGVVLEDVGPLDVAAEGLEDDSHDGVADMKFLAGGGTGASNRFNLPIHALKMRRAGRVGQSHSPHILALWRERGAALYG